MKNNLKIVVVLLGGYGGYKYLCIIKKAKAINHTLNLKIMTNEEKILAEFNAMFAQDKIEAEKKVEHLDFASLKESVKKVKESYTIEDVTPEGYGI